MFAQFFDGLGLHDHPLQRDRLLLRTIKDVRSVFVKHDRLSIDVSGVAETRKGHYEG